jgi:hypothetical protein
MLKYVTVTPRVRTDAAVSSAWRGVRGRGPQAIDRADVT